jgi:hypothetical protein
LTNILNIFLTVSAVENNSCSECKVKQQPNRRTESK